MPFLYNCASKRGSNHHLAKQTVGSACSAEELLSNCRTVSSTDLEDECHPWNSKDYKP